MVRLNSATEGWGARVSERPRIRSDSIEGFASYFEMSPCMTTARLGERCCFSPPGTILPSFHHCPYARRPPLFTRCELVPPVNSSLLPFKGYWRLVPSSAMEGLLGGERGLHSLAASTPQSGR